MLFLEHRGRTDGILAVGILLVLLGESKDANGIRFQLEILTLFLNCIFCSSFLLKFHLAFTVINYHNIRHLNPPLSLVDGDLIPRNTECSDER